MSRQPRLNSAEGVDHVTPRGVEQRDIAVDDEGRQVSLRWCVALATGLDRSPPGHVRSVARICEPHGIRLAENV